MGYSVVHEAYEYLTGCCLKIFIDNSAMNQTTNCPQNLTAAQLLGEESTEAPQQMDRFMNF